MKKAPPASPQARALRQRAEQKLREQHRAPERARSEHQARALVHELQVHQVELEMQNEELHRVQVQAQQAADKHAELFDFAPSGHFVLDPHGRIREVNLAGAALLGLDGQRVAGQSFDQYIVPDARAAFAEFRRGLHTDGGRRSCELRLLRHGHGTCDVLVVGALTGGPGEACRLGMIDITQRKRAEEELRQFNLELEQRVAARTLALNAANEALRGSRVATLNLAEDAVEARKRSEQAESALREAQAKLQAHAEELERTVALRTARLRETVAELEQFSYALVHDMRAPLRAMQSFAELVEEECAACERPRNKEYLRRIRLAASRLDQLITDSLNYSMAVRQELPLQPVELYPLLDGLVGTYPNLQPDLADIRVELNLPTVLGNEAALTQCFANLLGNAVKFAKPATKPHVRVWAEASPHSSSQFVRVWVEDHGIGIPRDARSRLFRMFQRASHGHEGTGIGLAIVRKVVERMGGQVGFESEEGEGSRFWADLRPAAPLTSTPPG